MGLSITESLREGFDRSTNRNAGVLFVLFFVYSLLLTVATSSVAAVLTPRMIERFREVSEEPLPPGFEEAATSSFPLAVSMPVALALVLIGVLWVLGETLRIISDRTFISEATVRLHEPTRWIGWATLSGLGVVLFLWGLWVFFGISVVLLAVMSPLAAMLWTLVGTLGLLVLSVLFFFARQEIATRDIDPITALTGSWSLVRHNGVKVFGLMVVLGLIGMITPITSGLFAPLGQLPAALLNLAVQAALLVLFSAITAQAYRQLRTNPTDTTTDGPAPPDDESDPHDEWNDPPL